METIIPQNIIDRILPSSLEIFKQFLNLHPNENLELLDEWVFSKIKEDNSHFRIIQTRDDELLFSLENTDTNEILRLYNYSLIEKDENKDKYRKSRNAVPNNATSVFKRIDVSKTLLDFMNNLRREK